MTELIRIPKGNAFNLHVCPQRIAPKQKDASFNDIDDLAVRLTRQGGEAVPVTHTRTEDGDLIIHCPETLKNVAYGVEIFGRYQGNAWRWADCAVLRMVDCNPESNVWGMESFAPETYYIYDDVTPSLEAIDGSPDGQTLVLETHGHAVREGDTLVLYEGERTTYNIEDGVLTITQHQNENRESQNCGHSRQCCCR